MRPLTLLLLTLLSACAPLAAGPTPVPQEPARIAVAVRDSTQVRAVVMGDQGTGTLTQRQVAAAMRAVCAQEGCDVGVGLGDNFYPAGPKDVTSPLFRERFETLYGPLGLPFFMIPGNHDESWIWGGDGADARGADVQIAYSRLHSQWVMPERFYRASLGELLEFFAVDTTPLAPLLPGLRVQERPGGEWAQAQQAWLAGALLSSSARWKVVLGHHPLFSNGKHGDAGAYDHLPFTFQRGGAVQDLYRVACGQAHLLLSGHDHALELFAPQSECPGTWTAVSGAAGKTEGRGSGQRPAAFELYGQPGFLWLAAGPEELTLRFYTLGQDGAPVVVWTQVLRRSGPT